jgi:hypothetical protein
VTKRGGERVRQRVLRARDITAARREKGDELAVAASRYRFGSLASQLVALSLHDRYIVQMGRTSIVP